LIRPLDIIRVIQTEFVKLLSKLSLFLGIQMTILFFKKLHVNHETTAIYYSMEDYSSAMYFFFLLLAKFDLCLICFSSSAINWYDDDVNNNTGSN
jgi:hypothetical protein